MKKFLLISLLLFGASLFVFAQEDTCADQVTQAITIAAESCTDMQSNEVCFGHDTVKTVVNCEDAPDFATPGDIIPVDVTCALRTTAMDADGGWGIALLKVPAYGSDQDMTYVVLGGVELQNASSEKNQIQVWTDQDIEMRTGPGSQYEVIETIPGDTQVYANACNCTGNWLRTVLDDGRVGWISTFHVTVLGDIDEIPITAVDTPVYQALQAFNFESNPEAPDCTAAPNNGILVQIPESEAGVSTQVNSVSMLWSKSTAYLQSSPGGNFTIDMLDGEAIVTAGDYTMYLKAGMRMVIPMSELNLPLGEVYVEPYAYEDIQNLPVSLLPEAIELVPADSDVMPHIVGQELCDVVSGLGDVTCPIHFVNADGDNIVSMDVEFVYAAQGEWTSSERDDPALIDGDNFSGRIAWDVSCNLGSENVISPVTWSVTITDEQGHTSEPMEVWFSCVDG